MLKVQQILRVTILFHDSRRIASKDRKAKANGIGLGFGLRLSPPAPLASRAVMGTRTVRSELTGCGRSDFTIEMLRCLGAFLYVGAISS